MLRFSATVWKKELNYAVCKDCLELKLLDFVNKMLGYQEDISEEFCSNFRSDWDNIWTNIFIKLLLIVTRFSDVFFAFVTFVGEPLGFVLYNSFQWKKVWSYILSSCFISLLQVAKWRRICRRTYLVCWLHLKLPFAWIRFSGMARNVLCEKEKRR